MDLELTPFNEERYRAEQRNATAIHEAGHVVAAYALGIGMRNKGVVLRDSQVQGFAEGVAYTHNPGIRSRDQQWREVCLRKSIVISFAGPVAQHMVGEIVIDSDVDNIAWHLRQLLAPKRRFLRKLITSALKSGDYSYPFWNLIFTLVTHTDEDRDRALRYLNDYLDDNEVTDENTDEDEREVVTEANARVCEILWPLAQEAQSIIDHQWSAVEKLSCELLRKRSLGRADIEAIIGAGLCGDQT